MLDDDDMLVGFLDEAREHVTMIEPDLLALEDVPGDMDVINRLFRSVHSIKGGAGFFGLDNMSALAHVMENLMSKARNSKLVVGRDHVDALLKGVDRLTAMIDDVANSNDMDVSEEIAVLEILGNEEAAAASVEGSIAPPVKEVPTVVVSPAFVAPIVPLTADEPSATTPQAPKFNIAPEELESAIQDGMNVYAVSVFLNRDITNQGKTPFQFISELEELGRFIDSYLDVDGASELDECLDEDLRFVFAFATVMDPELAAGVLGVKEDQISLINMEEIERFQAFESESSQPEQAPVVEPAVEVKAEKPVEPVIAIQDSIASPPPEPALAPLESPVPKKLPAKPLPKKSEKALTPRSKVKTEESIRVGVGKLNKLVDLAGELVLVRNQLLQASEKEAKKIPGLLAVLADLNTVTTELQEEILNTRMQAISTVFGKFPRLIRELGANLGKEIALVTEGNEVELDKTVLEALSDPLTHIIRNTADHGIEVPEERRAKGKPIQGKLLLKAYHESGQVIILVQDDGNGIDADKIAAKAYEKGMITEDNFYNFSAREKLNLIFLAGLSTAENVSSVSGRGVGMDVVRSNIEQIGGTVELHSEVGQGTTIKMTLPLTMAIVSCLIVQTGKERFAIPQINLEELVMLKPDDYGTMLGYVQDREVLKLRGELLPLISLSRGLDIPETKKGSNRRLLAGLARNQKTGSNAGVGSAYNLVEGSADMRRSEDALRILIVSVGINKVGIIVDSIVGSEEIVVKPMPEFLQHLPFFSGSTILGDGTVAMILDTLGFVQSNQLFFTDRQGETYSHEDARKKVEEEQSLLIFDNGTEEQFAITIPLIQRVDELTLDQIQRVGEKEYIEYRGRQMRILHLADYLPIQKPDYEGVETVSLIIPKETRIPVGILIHQVIDTKTLYIDITEGSIHADGILGSTLIDSRITLLLDLYAILEMGEPDSLHRVEFEPKLVQSSKILLIEDTPLFQNIVREYLHSVGFEVIVAADGQEGLDALEKDTFDVVLCDIEMPVLDGFGVIQKIRATEKWQDLPVIALTSLNDDETVQKGLEAGFNEWMVKLDKQKILECLNRYL
ncbi:MAG: hybrid sensor histidine kinase/response regulator [SAR324 cluster bacterium]|uniref:histidine kinase n=1 Tax=SAR324 cluster bacterium TaxID=2024889 RepID=A0A2A4TAQ8_9DELT|nr:MAG: hybrid sensor histidine kinase/response regulator [SAR324 cluster bacterium]